MFYQEFFKKLSYDDLVLTPNKKLAGFLRNRYLQQHSYRKYWQTPLFLPLSTWLEQTWETLQVLGTDSSSFLLNSNQVTALWEKIVRESEYTHHLLKPLKTSQVAHRAWELCLESQIAWNDPSFQQTESSQIWQRWAEEYHSLCEKNDWVDIHLLKESLCDSKAEALWQTPKTIYLIGFNELCPQYKKLFAHLKKRKWEVHEINEGQTAPKVSRISLGNPELELKTMARWANHHLNNGKKNIGCIVLNLQDQQNAVENEFIKACQPKKFFPNQQDLEPPFNINLNKKIIDLPLIQTALKILFLKNENKLTHIGLLLRSPFIGYAEQEINNRALLDAKLRSFGEKTVSLALLLLTAKQEKAIEFSNLVTNFLTVSKQKEKLSVIEWAQFFTKQLQAWQWPGQRALSTTEQKIMEQWSQLLNQFSNLSIVLGEISHEEALNQLHNLAQQQIFHENTIEKPIQIFNLSDAIGFQFEELWVMGLHDNAWPPAPTPNPFIPFEIQRQQQLPHSSASSELITSKTITRQLCTSASQVIFSYPEHIDDEEMRCSGLIKFANVITSEQLDLSSVFCYEQKIIESASFEELEDETGTALPIAAKVAGGANVLKYQAACPFRAYAEFRLGAKEIISPQSGLDKLARGSLLHKVLEACWNKLESHDNLMNYSEDSIKKIIEQALEKTLLGFSKKRSATLQQKFVEIETSRLQRLIQAWLEYEKERAAFKVIATESAFECSIGNLELVLKADRIDQLPNGERIIFDYKTGEPKVSSWLDERMDEPQLPLYCVSSQDKISGIVFAKVRSDEHKFYGVTENETAKIPNVYTSLSLQSEKLNLDWHQLVSRWKEILTKLGEQFMSGYAKVDPKKFPDTCKNCRLQSFCRIYDIIDARNSLD